MYLLLIRHGESVDNVAGLYAGSRDSPLTSHGVLQAQRLGTHLASRRDALGPVTHIFTSNLQRAYRTAGAIADAQRDSSSRSAKTDSNPQVVQLPELREKDFGSAEGVKYKALSTGRADGSIASDSEGRDAMLVRVNRFIVNDLIPVLERWSSEKASIAVVAHGLILGTLLEALRRHFPARIATPVLSEGSRSGAFWSNTGVLQAKIESTIGPPGPVVDSEDTVLTDQATRDVKGNNILPPCRLTMTVQRINNIDHLDGLKKTRGGIGSSQFDARQRSVTAFFTPTAKKRKIADAES